jgi:hypothetical protein
MTTSTITRDPDVTVRISTGNVSTGSIPAGTFSEVAAHFTDTKGVQPFPAQANDDQPYPIPIVLEPFDLAPDLEDLARELIEHYRLPAERADMILYRWRAKGGTSQGQAKVGACQKPAGLLAHFARADFVVWLAADNLAIAEATYRQVRAALFHELFHIQPGDDGELTATGHDFEGFGDEVRAFGLWHEGLKTAGKAVRQLPMDLDSDADPDDDTGSEDDDDDDQ